MAEPTVGQAPVDEVQECQLEERRCVLMYEPAQAQAEEYEAFPRLTQDTA